jgi:hypothetical protein
MSFEWRTDEQEAWPEPDGTATPGSQGSSRWLRLRLLATLLLFTLAAVLLVTRMAGVRVTAATTKAEQELLATDALLREAAAAGDTDLIGGLLQGSEEGRESSQLGLAGQLPLDRTAYGFYLDAEAIRSAEPESWLSPDLQRAVVTYTLPYTVVQPSGVVVATALKHTINYRRNGGSWHWVEPEDSYWGEWITDESDEQFLIVYPERDAATGARLAHDMRAWRPRLCAALGGCPRGLRLQLRMEREYATLRQVRRAFEGRSGLLTTVVAAPSAIGVIQDEIGYQALLRGYLRLLTGVLLQQMVDESSSARGAYGEALRQRVLVDLGLLAWPPPGEVGSHDEVMPAGMLYALCSAGVTEGTNLYRVDLAGGSWDAVIGGRNFVNMIALPGTDALLLQETVADDRGSEPRLILVRDGVSVARLDGLVLSATAERIPVIYAYDENQEQLVLNFQDVDRCGDGTCDIPRIYASNAAWSPDGTRTVLRRPQEGSKSPPVAGEMLYLGDRNGLDVTPLAPGYNPFWLDNDTYGYVQLEIGDTGAAVGTDAIVLSEVAAFRPRVIVERARLEAFVTREAEPYAPQLFIGYVSADPADVGRLHIMAGLFRRFSSSEQVYDLYFFSADIASGEVRLELALSEAVLDERPVRSDRGWLAFTSFDLRTQSAALTVHDEASGQTQRYPLASVWPAGQTRLPALTLSPDEEWLLFLEDGVLRLIHPVDGTSRRVVPPFPGCAIAVWTDS